MEFKKTFMIFLVLVIFVSGFAIIVHNNFDKGKASKTTIQEYAFSVKTEKILKVLLNNHTMFMYDNNFTLITNPNLIAILNNSNNEQNLVTLSNNEIPNVNSEFYAYVHLTSNVPLNEMFFYDKSNIHQFVVQTNINYFAGSVYEKYKMLSFIDSNTAYGLGSDTGVIQNVTFTFANTYMLFYNQPSNTSLTDKLGYIPMGNFTFSKISFANIISNFSISNEVLFSQTGFYDLIFNTTHTGNLTLAGDKIIIQKNNINGTNNILLKNGTYTYTFVYRENNQTKYFNGTLNIFGSNVKLNLNPNQLIVFNFDNIIWLILLLISSFLIMFILQNYLLALINVIGFIAIGILNNIGYDLMGYLLIIVLFLSLWIAYNVSMRNGESVINYGTKVNTGIRERFKRVK